MSVLTLDPFDREQGRDAALWTVAALVVAALHVGIAVAYLLLRPAPEGRAEAPAIDVAFMPAVAPPAPAAPEALPATPIPPVEQSMLEPPRDEPAPAEPAATPEAVTAPTPLQPQPEKVEPQPEPPIALTTPEPPRADDAIVAPPPSPPPKPVEAKPETHKPVPAHEQVRRKEDEAREKTAHRVAPPKPAAAASRPMRMASAPNPGAESEGARAGQASWNREVEARLARAAAYPADGGGASGTAMVSVAIDRNGRLRSHRLARSSGAQALDRAAMSIVERAQPYPPFPPAMTQSQVTLNVPLHLRPR
ncbi:Energy transducer [Bradyrhizobium sp. STM 3843]|uniref:energy transducer TonB family protein n=1 Tax=Bradyrhizobium sp. STM 3843 TaxID=551947 RepID=UPI0002404096|nr:TonB family protein [Bradyrhizobium sp. STM 3843]CCE10978.1 Energy transducer [Bradyrhizobium sp. STM 3843]